MAVDKIYLHRGNLWVKLILQQKKYCYHGHPCWWMRKPRSRDVKKLSQIRHIRGDRDEIATQIHHWLQSGVLVPYSNPHPQSKWRMSLLWQKLTLILGTRRWHHASVAQSTDTIRPPTGAGSLLGALWCTLHPFLDDPTPERGKHSPQSSKWRGVKGD